MKYNLRWMYAFMLLLCMQEVVAQQKLLSPGQFLGYTLGEQFTTHARLIDYVQQLALQVPGKIKIETYGYTYEGRPLYLVYVASEENLLRLEQIRENNLRQAGLLEGQVQGKQPVVLWMSYNVHGNEAVSSEAVMQVLYELVNPAAEQSGQWLQNTVVLLDPCANPDGRERYVQWYNQAANQPANASPHAWEHHEPWPGGRLNHYYFDLNRDWAWQTQAETKQRVAIYNKWLPQVHADFHEMPLESSYYFSPAAKPLHESVTPWQLEFQQTLGEYNRRNFDKNNWLYFTRERFDLLYPSYGDTWPTFNGAIGVTYEQGGSGRAGLAYKKEDGDTLTLTQRIAHHVAASMATVQATSGKADQLKQQFRKYYADNLNNPQGAYKTFVFKKAYSDSNFKALTDFLEQQGISYGYAAKNYAVRGYNYTTGKMQPVKVMPADLVISMYQPKSTLVKVLLEPIVNLEDSLTYDITSWALPYAFGIEAYAVKSRIEPVDESPTIPRTAITIEKPYAYIARWKSLQDLKFLTDLLQQSIRVRVSETAFEIDKQKYEPGTLLITRSGNEQLGEKLDKTVREVAQKHHVNLNASATGFVSSGTDFGARSVRLVKPPKVAVLAGEDISAYNFGEVWHFFEQQINYPITVLHTSYFNKVPLHEFDVLILPDGKYEQVLSEKTLEQVSNWVKAGGKLIALESAAGYLAGKKNFNLKYKNESLYTDESASKAHENAYELLHTYGNRGRESLSEEVQGSVYRVQLDNTHPLAFGYGNFYFALMQSADAFAFMEDGWNVGFLKKDNYITGFVGAKAREQLQDTFILGVQEMEEGQVIYMTANPLFRAFWHSSKLLFGNAVFLVE